MPFFINMLYHLLALALVLQVVHCNKAPFEPIDLKLRAEECLERVKCRFRTCSNIPTIFFPAVGFASNPAICLLGSDIGPVFEIGEPSVKSISGRKVRLTPISNWSPAGLKPKFGKDVFEPQKLVADENSGLIRKYVRGNQNRITHGTCFHVPVKTYALQLPDRRCTLVKTNKAVDCFVFVANTPDIVFELQWYNTGDDLDLTVTEPDGTMVNYTHPTSACAKLVGGDANVDGCDLNKEARETVAYFRDCPDFRTGKYKLTVRHLTNCGEGGTRYYLRAIQDGNVIKELDGYSYSRESVIIAEMELFIR